MSRPGPRLLAAQCRLYRRLLFLLPSGLRRRRGEEIVTLFRDQLRGEQRRRGVLGVMAVWRRSLGGLVVARLAGDPGRRPCPDRIPPGDPFMRRILDDVRLAARTLRRNPGFAALAILTLGVGLGATTAIFGLVHAVLIEPLSYPQADRLVYLDHAAPAMGFDSDLGTAPGLHVHYAAHSRELDALGYWQAFDAALTGDGEPERVPAAQATSGLFETLGARPLLGRLFLPDDDSPDTDRAAILGHSLWQRRYGGDPGIVGSTIQVGGRDVQVVGVLPASFVPPGQGAELWLTNAWSLERFGSFSVEGIGRLRPGATVDSLRGELDDLIADIGRTFPDPRVAEVVLEGGVRSLAVPLKQRWVGDVAPTLWILLGTVGLVLLAACANVANLFLVRAEGRRREIAVRVALGASRRRLLHLFLAESLLLSAVSAVVGIGLAAAGSTLLLRGAPVTIPRLAEVDPDPVVLGVTAVLALLAGLVFGGAPVLRAPRSAGAGLQEGGRTATAGGGRVRVRQLLVAAQMALALVVLLGAGLMARSFWRVQGIEPGFDAGDLLVFEIGLPGARYPDDAAAARFHRELLRELSSLPGVTAVAGASDLPLETLENGDWVARVADPPAEGELPPVMWVNRVSPDAFAALGQPLVAGRALTRADDEDDLPVALVNRSGARLLWGEDVLLGDRVTIGLGSPDQEPTEYAIVGVVGDAVQADMVSATRPALYLPLGNTSYGARSANRLSYALRTAVPPLSLAEPVRRTVWAADPGLPIVGLTTMEARIRAARAPAAFTLLLLGIAATVATLLGSVGLYGVVAWIVRQRASEIGIRMALGARARDVVGLMLSQGLTVSVLGLGVGLAASVLLAGTIESLLYDVAPLDPSTYAAAVMFLLAVAGLATWLPARRAARIEPSESLRQE